MVYIIKTLYRNRFISAKVKHRIYPSTSQYISLIMIQLYMHIINIYIYIYIYIYISLKLYL